MPNISPLKRASPKKRSQRRNTKKGYKRYEKRAQRSVRKKSAMQRDWRYRGDRTSKKKTLSEKRREAAILLQNGVVKPEITKIPGVTPAATSRKITHDEIIAKLHQYIPLLEMLDEILQQNVNWNTKMEIIKQNPQLWNAMQDNKDDITPAMLETYQKDLEDIKSFMNGTLRGITAAIQKYVDTDDGKLPGIWSRRKKFQATSDMTRHSSATVWVDEEDKKLIDLQSQNLTPDEVAKRFNEAYNNFASREPILIKSRLKQLSEQLLFTAAEEVEIEYILSHLPTNSQD